MVTKRMCCGNANLTTILCGGKALGYKHGTHVDYNLPKIGKYDVSHAQEHYRICFRPVAPTPASATCC